jgi:hypothetical protein
MTVENDSQTMASCTLNDPIHERQAIESLQIRIELVVDALRFARGIEELVAEGQANGVEASLGDLAQHVLPVTSPQPMGGEGMRLKAKPVDAYQAYLAPRRIRQLTMKAVKEPCCMVNLHCAVAARATGMEAGIQTDRTAIAKTRKRSLLQPRKEGFRKLFISLLSFFSNPEMSIHDDEGKCVPDNEET